MIRIDTNYIIRYLVNDNIEMADIAEEILTTKDVFISNKILAEVIYVFNRSQIAFHSLPNAIWSESGIIHTYSNNNCFTTLG